MKAIGIIPARLASTRFPNKPLVYIGGKTMIQRVYEQACKCKLLDKVVVATDHQLIAEEVQRFGGQFIMTSETCKNGTERSAEAIRNIDEQYDIVVNIQGDEPFFEPDSIQPIIDCFEHEATEIATLVKEITDLEEVMSPTVVKVVYNQDHHAQYFSRAAIPHHRDNNSQRLYFKHIGIYAYRAAVLQEIATLAPTPLELTEQLEQLRWLENGYKIAVGFTNHDSNSVDTPEDLRLLKQQFNIP